ARVRHRGQAARHRSGGRFRRLHVFADGGDDRLFFAAAQASRPEQSRDRLDRYARDLQDIRRLESSGWKKGEAISTSFPSFSAKAVAKSLHISSLNAGSIRSSSMYFMRTSIRRTGVVPFLL